VLNGGSFTYRFIARNAGTRWYHDHVGDGQMNGLFGMFVIEDPGEEPADLDVPVVLHDVPIAASIDAAMAGRSSAPMVDPPGSPELAEMPDNDKMGDEVAYQAHCINGRSYPGARELVVRVGQRVRFRILNANPTQTRYVRLAEQALSVTHADGNPLAAPVVVDALRLGVSERYDAWFTPNIEGAWLLQSISANSRALEQSMVVRTTGAANRPPAASPQTLDGLRVLSYDVLGGASHDGAGRDASDVAMDFTLGGGDYGSSRWTLNGAVWPNTPKVRVRRNDRVVLRFKNTTDMEHPLHLHGHTFFVTRVNGVKLRRPLAKDTALVAAEGGTLELTFVADAPPGRWLLHCHNQIHMMDGMMTEVVYDA
jgi:FtsP/CotA-like multicopper oxidase with cupredoxin domain